MNQIREDLENGRPAGTVLVYLITLAKAFNAENADQERKEAGNKSEALPPLDSFLIGPRHVNEIVIMRVEKIVEKILWGLDGWLDKRLLWIAAQNAPQETSFPNQEQRQDEPQSLTFSYLQSLLNQMEQLSQDPLENDALNQLIHLQDLVTGIHQKIIRLRQKLILLVWRSTASHFPIDLHHQLGNETMTLIMSYFLDDIPARNLPDRSALEPPGAR
ncbi:hypothetical protein [Sneathiella aquimaris]|uniref:hypothetical protein n=1 Tax=Sneathiella aquimaris TaxID=2599305 RepID=UPI00146C6208|nr:hypothetical protein [Sneathiella aquimaris]